MKFLIPILLLLAGVHLTAWGAVSASVSPEDSSGSRILTLENEFLKAEFSTQGGRLIQLISKKSGKNLVWNNGNPESGSFKDQFPPMQFDFRNSQYSGQISVNTPEKAVLVLRSLPTSGRWKFQTITRTVSLSKGESVLRCTLELLNQTENMAPVTFDYWQHNFFGVAGEDNSFFVPTAEGPIGFVPSASSNNRFFREPVRGWLAMIGKSGNGVVILPEYKRLALVYAWWCKESLPLDTMEWRLFPEKIQAGNSLKTTFELGIISGLDKISGAGTDGCGVIELPGQIITGTIPIKLKLNGFTEKEIRYKALLNGQVVAEGKSSMKPEQVTEAVFELKNISKGVYPLLIQITNLSGDQLLFDLAAPLRVDGEKGNVTFAALEPRIESAEETEAWQFEFSDTVKTPHYPWLSKKEKSADVLFLLPVDGIRDMIEMKQRMPLNPVTPTVFPSSFSMSWRVNVSLPPGSEQNGTEFVEKYLDGKHYQAIVIGSEARAPWVKKRVLWSTYPQSVRTKILNQVKNGAGLLYINPEGVDAELKKIFEYLKPIPAALSASMDFQSAPFFSRTNIRTGTYGRGRIVVIQYPAQGFLTPHAGGRANEFQILKNDHRYQEYQFAILCRLLNWSMGKDIVLSGMKMTQDSVVLDSLAAGNVTLDLFDRYTQPLGTIRASVKPGKNRIPISGLRGGTNYVHARFEDRDFAFASADVKPEERICGITMKSSFAKKETVAGKVKLSAKAEKECTVKVEIRDQTGRVVHRQDGLHFTWKPENAVVNRHTVRARLLKNGKVVDEFQKPFNLPEVFHASENFSNLLWAGSDCVPEYTIPYRWEAVRSFGFNFLYAGGTAEPDFCRLMQVANLEVGSNWLGPYMFHSHSGLAEWEKTHDKKYLKRPQCPNNPAQWDPTKAGSSAELFHDFGTRHIFQLGDEMSMTYYNAVWDVCFCPFCMKDFRAWLQQRYPSLDALNKEWATAFKTWEEVIPMTRIEIFMHASPAPWVEHRLYMDQLFAKTLQAIRTNLRKKYPGANVGPTGVNQPPHVYGGNWNFWNMREFECASMYGTARIPLSFRRNQRIVMQYRGYETPESVTRYSFWEGIFAGERNTNNWWEPIFILPDLRESVLRQYYKEILWELRSGVGDLLYHTAKQTDQVAILHSQNSLISNFIKQKKSDYYQKELAFATALEDLGIAYRFIAPEELENGVLKQFKALILPEASALSDKEAEAIRSFVRGGGTLIADYEPGIQNEVCNPRKTPVLNDLFGITTQSFNLRKVVSHNLPDLVIHQAGHGIKTSAGKALYEAETDNGKVPLVVVSKFGSGKTAFLNFVPEYNTARMHGTDKGFLKLLDQLLGIRSCGRAESDSPVMHSYYRNGNNLYVTLLPVPPKGMWQKMTLAELKKKSFDAPFRTEEKGHLYDVRSGKYLGYGNSFHIRLTPGDGTVLALLPYSVKKLTVEHPAEAKQGEKVTLKTAVRTSSSAGHHVLLMRVFEPDGRENLEYRQIKSTADGRRDFTLPFAWNDAKGTWKIRIKDAASGVTAEKTLTLK